MADDFYKDGSDIQRPGGNVVAENSPEKEEMLPIKPPLQALKYKTINKRFGWWAAVVLLQSYAKKQVCFYLWQRKDDIWKRKQKFGIHSKEDWALIKKAVEEYVTELT